MKSYQGIPDTKCTNCPNRDRCPILCFPVEIVKEICPLFKRYNQPVNSDLKIDGKALRQFMYEHLN